jgi:hypothetical protein
MLGCFWSGQLDQGHPFFYCPDAKETGMPPLPEGYQRKGKMCAFQLDFDAVDMLREIAPTDKSLGRTISELIRREFIRRQEWVRRRERQQAGLAEVGADE